MIQGLLSGSGFMGLWNINSNHETLQDAHMAQQTSAKGVRELRDKLHFRYYFFIPEFNAL